MEEEMINTPSEQGELLKSINHNRMINRDHPDQHPIEAISGWIELNKEDIEKLWNNKKE